MAPYTNPRYGWILLGTFAINYSMVVVAIETIGLFLPQMAEEMSLSPSQQGWLAASVMFSNLLLEIPANWLFSRYRPWRASVASFSAAVIFVAFNGWAPTFAVLLLARVGLGIIYLSVQSSRTLLILQWIPRRRLGIANGILFSVLETVIGLGFVIMPLIMAAVGDWRNALYVWAGACGVGTVVWLIVGRDTKNGSDRDTSISRLRSPIGALLRYREPWILGLGVMGASAGRSAFTSFWPTYTGEEYGTAITMAGLILGVSSMAKGPMILVVTLTSFIASRTPMLLIVCGSLQCVTFLGMVFGESLPLQCLSGIGNGLINCHIPAMITVIYSIPRIQEREAAVAVAVYFSCLWTGAALGPLLVGLVGESTGDIGVGLSIAALTPLTLVAAGLVIQWALKDTQPIDMGGYKTIGRNT